MDHRESLGLKRVDALHFYVHDLERSRRFYVDGMDFAETGTSDPALEDRDRQRSAVFEAGEVRVVCTAPLSPDSPAGRHLARHPDGVAVVDFEVEDAARAFALLESRGGTPVEDLREEAAGGGVVRHFALATPFGDTLFRFVERQGTRAPFAGFAPHDAPRGGHNRFGFERIDHLTSNFRTLSPMLLWCEQVLGFRRFWDVEFHTQDVARTATDGSGLRSVVVWDPDSGIKFATNEPWRPHFERSQIWRFVIDNAGEGIQHAALTTPDLIGTVRGLRGRDMQFMPTPGTYYDLLPERLRTHGIERIDEDPAVLRELEILVDGEGRGRYLLQIFLKDAAGLYGEPASGPFFYELIQRKGDEGFGAGNFRALFESIERDQLQGGGA